MNEYSVIKRRYSVTSSCESTKFRVDSTITVVIMPRDILHDAAALAAGAVSHQIQTMFVNAPDSCWTTPVIPS